MGLAQKRRTAQCPMAVFNTHKMGTMVTDMKWAQHTLLAAVPCLNSKGNHKQWVFMYFLRGTAQHHGIQFMACNAHSVVPPKMPCVYSLVKVVCILCWQKLGNCWCKQVENTLKTHQLWLLLYGACFTHGCPTFKHYLTPTTHGCFFLAALVFQRRHRAYGKPSLTQSTSINSTLTGLMKLI